MNAHMITALEIYNLLEEHLDTSYDKNDTMLSFISKVLQDMSNKRKQSSFDKIMVLITNYTDEELSVLSPSAVRDWFFKGLSEFQILELHVFLKEINYHGRISK